MKTARLVLSVLVIVALLFNFIGCSSNTLSSGNLMVGITPNKVAVSTELKEDAVNVNNFSLELFKNSIREGENTLVSPLSVIYALGMTANGAKGETLKQMEDVFGMKSQDLNVFLYSLMDVLKKNESAKLKLANSVWFTDDKSFNVSKDFLQTNADYYGADAYKEIFDNSLVEKVNGWVGEKTNKRIDKVIDESFVSPNTIMYLINALYFEAEWDYPYYNNNVEKGVFATNSGKKQKCEFMYGNEGTYLESKNATGFVKPYKDCNYAFVALLPNKDLTVEKYLETLNYDSLNRIFASTENARVMTAIPKFETEFDCEMKETLKTMGMALAFDRDNADFSNIGKSKIGNIYISKIKHKTFISFNEDGTKAGAATAAEFSVKSMLPIEEKQVYLDRPFVYMIIDTNTNFPIFIGAQNSIR